MAMIRCKMWVTEVTSTANAAGCKDQCERVKLIAVGNENEENKAWAKWTPNAVFEILITNPDAINKLLPGREFFVDFTPV